ncbi:MAG: Twin-arginine translocation pathway signal, partial [Stackebrandtia sp.]
MSSDLDALVESVRLSLHAPSPAACDQLDSAVATFALTYSAHPPAALFAAVHATRSLVASAMSSAPETLAVRMMDAAGWLSALLGNLSYHLDARPAAATHWAAAAHLAAAVDDRRLTAWTRGAQAMLARADGDPSSALDYANDGLANAADPTQRAQLLAWGVLPSLAELGRESDAAEALGQ